MTDPSTDEPTFARRVWGFLQWLLVIPLLLLTLLLLLATGDHLSAPGAPVGKFYTALGLLTLALVCLSPPIFFRLPRFGKVGSYVGLVASFIFFFAPVMLEVTEAYERTPKGAREAAERSEKEAEEAARRAKLQEAQDRIAEVAALSDQIEAELARLEACRSWGGEVSSFSELVRESLHNPDSFEHVETVFIKPDSDSNNVAMRFRGENAFGATRTATVKARLNPADCTITSVEEPVTD